MTPARSLARGVGPPVACGRRLGLDRPTRRLARYVGPGSMGPPTLQRIAPGIRTGCQRFRARRSALRLAPPEGRRFCGAPGARTGLREGHRGRSPRAPYGPWQRERADLERRAAPCGTRGGSTRHGYHRRAFDVAISPRPSKPLQSYLSWVSQLSGAAWWAWSVPVKRNEVRPPVPSGSGGARLLGAGRRLGAHHEVARRDVSPGSTRLPAGPAARAHGSRQPEAAGRAGGLCTRCDTSLEAASGLVGR